jgi:hypothetical protein
LTLPESARAQVAGSLLDSLDSAEVQTSWSRAWAADVAKRVKAVDLAKAKLLLASELRRHALKSRREPNRRHATR